MDIVLQFKKKSPKISEKHYFQKRKSKYGNN